MFDVSGIVDPTTWYATVLEGVFSFSPQTTWREGIAWPLYAVPVMTLFLLGVRRRDRRPAAARTPVATR